jgi:CheY-like chemotaxis protein
MKKILLIDDSQLALAITTDVIADLGYECIQSLSGFEGIEKYKSEQPDCVIVDLIMPKMDGFQVIEELFKINNDLNIVTLSASLTDENLKRLEQLKIKYYIEKPVSKYKMEKVLNKIFLS